MSNTTGTDLRAMLLDDADVAALVDSRISLTWVPALRIVPFLWLSRRSVEYLDVLGETEETPFREFWDVEAVAQTELEAVELADAVRTACRAWVNDRANNLGMMGDGTYGWLDTTDQAEDYVARNADPQDLLAISTLQIEVTNA